MKIKKKNNGQHPQEDPLDKKLKCDYEKFVKSFEKPTQLYKYLSNRHVYSKLFLQRTLTYMPRTAKLTKRRNHKIDVLAKFLRETQSHNGGDRKSDEMLKIEILGICAKPPKGYTKLETEVIMRRISQKRDQEGLKTLSDNVIAKLMIPCFIGTGRDHKPCIVTVTEDDISQNGCPVREFQLLFKVKCPRAKRESKSDKEDGIRRRTRASGPLAVDEIVETDEPTPCLHEGVEYGTSGVVVCGRTSKVLLNGEYEVILTEELGHEEDDSSADSDTDSPKEDRKVKCLHIFKTHPVLKFRVLWSSFPLAPQLSNGLHTPVTPRLVKHSISCPGSPASRLPEHPECVYYHFLCGGKYAWPTVAGRVLRCPWCDLVTARLTQLLKHLRMCHSRFNFIYTAVGDSARIDVSVSELYDGSYAGNPQDLTSHIGVSFCRLGPSRRTPVTELLVSRPKRPKLDLNEFTEPESDIHSLYQNLQGHNRLYYHTHTLQPLRPSEINIDSEDENDPEWLRHRTMQLIDDFTDVNDGEKEIMKMWNLHILKYNYLGDCQLHQACTTFVDQFGAQVISGNLCKNLLLHLVSLHDFGLISTDLLTRTMMQLYHLRDRQNAERSQTLEHQSRAEKTPEKTCCSAKESKCCLKKASLPALSIQLTRVYPKVETG